MGLVDVIYLGLGQELFGLHKVHQHKVGSFSMSYGVGETLDISCIFKVQLLTL